MCPNCVPWCHREHPYNALMVSTVPRWFYSSFFLFSLGNSSAATSTRPSLASAAACCKTRCALTQTTGIYKNKGGVICWNLFWLVWECLKGDYFTWEPYVCVYGIAWCQKATWHHCHMTTWCHVTPQCDGHNLPSLFFSQTSDRKCCLLNTPSSVVTHLLLLMECLSQMIFKCISKNIYHESYIDWRKPRYLLTYTWRYYLSNSRDVLLEFMGCHESFFIRSFGTISEVFQVAANPILNSNMCILLCKGMFLELHTVHQLPRHASNRRQGPGSCRRMFRGRWSGVLHRLTETMRSTLIWISQICVHQEQKRIPATVCQRTALLGLYALEQ